MRWKKTFEIEFKCSARDLISADRVAEAIRWLFKECDVPITLAVREVINWPDERDCEEGDGEQTNV